MASAANTSRIRPVKLAVTSSNTPPNSGSLYIEPKGPLSKCLMKSICPETFCIQSLKRLLPSSVHRDLLSDLSWDSGVDWVFEEVCCSASRSCLQLKKEKVSGTDSRNSLVPVPVLRAKTFWSFVYENSTISPADARRMGHRLNVLGSCYFAVRIECSFEGSCVQVGFLMLNWFVATYAKTVG